MRHVKFTYNFNGKLHCKAFTSLRLENPDKYFIGETYEIYLKDELVKHAVLESFRTIKISEINLFIARLDTGLNVEKCIAMIKAMYKKRFLDWENQKIYFLLFMSVEAENSNS